MAAGNPPPALQWRRNGVNVAGATETSLAIPVTSLTDSGAIHSVVASNALGSATSNDALLEVLDPPAIVRNPASVTVIAPADATFTVIASGSPARLRPRGNRVSSPTTSRLKRTPCCCGAWAFAGAGMAPEPRLAGPAGLAARRATRQGDSRTARRQGFHPLRCHLVRRHGITERARRVQLRQALWTVRPLSSARALSSKVAPGSSCSGPGAGATRRSLAGTGARRRQREGRSSCILANARYRLTVWSSRLLPPARFDG